jgi:hypothetical protein
MKKWFIILFFSRSCFAQFTDTIPNNSYVNPEIVKQKKPEILTNGFVDVMNNGQMNASARLFKLYLGEPEKFVVPISLYIGVTGNNLTSAIRSNESLLLNIVNPLSGVMNISVDATHFLLKKGEALNKCWFTLSIWGTTIKLYRYSIFSNRHFYEWLCECRFYF